MYLLQSNVFGQPYRLQPLPVGWIGYSPNAVGAGASQVNNLIIHSEELYKSKYSDNRNVSSNANIKSKNSDKYWD
jgi:hypothetical protein